MHTKYHISVSQRDEISVMKKQQQIETNNRMDIKNMLCNSHQASFSLNFEHVVSLSDSLVSLKLLMGWSLVSEQGKAFENVSTVKVFLSPCNPFMYL